MFKNLKILDLGKNQLSGPIPPEIGNLTNVLKMYVESPPRSGEFEFLQFSLTLFYFFHPLLPETYSPMALLVDFLPSLGI